jgi:cell wall-associated NlpC family hydrolase
LKQLAALTAAALVVLVAAPLLLAAVVVSTVPAAAACSSTVAVPATGAWRPPFQQPYTLTSPFGHRARPVNRFHAGLDLVSLPGPGPVVAASAGTLTVGWDPGGYGHYVTIDHGAGTATRYGHLATLAPGLTTGDAVWAGQQLGVEGSTGHSTGNHLHFEVRVNGTPVDPVPFMADHGAPLDGTVVSPSATPGTGLVDLGRRQGGIGFPLPPPGTPRLHSLDHPALPIPPAVQALYVAAANRYHLPWTLLAGIGMEETGHGRTTATSSAGAQGLMQFRPATWARYGVDGDRDGRANITNPADSTMAAANYLTATGVTAGPDGVRRALLAYNPAGWYINDVLHYAAAYGGGTVPGDPTDCGPTTDTGAGGATGTPVDQQAIATLLGWARSHLGDPYVFGANGPHAWDCSSFTKAAYARIGLTLPRTASAQRNWLAAGHGTRITPGQEKPGDLLFVDSYLGPNQIGHVMIIADPTGHRTLEAGGAKVGSYDYAHRADSHIYEIWRPGAPTPP